MIIAAMTFRLHAPWVHSLKEKLGAQSERKKNDR